MGAPKRCASQEPQDSTLDSKKQRVISGPSSSDEPWRTNPQGNRYRVGPNGSYEYLNRPGTNRRTVYRKNGTQQNPIFVTPEKNVFYYPHEFESGDYCTGTDWRTGNTMTCWKTKRGVLVRTPERKSYDDGTCEILTDGVPIRTPVRNEERDMLKVTFLTYMTERGIDVIYEVDENGMYNGIGEALIDNLRDATISKRCVFPEFLNS